MARRRKDPDPDEVLAFIQAQPLRRVVSVGMVAVLGALLWVIAVLRPPESFLWMLYLVFLGAGCLWMAWAMWQSTARQIVLTRRGLTEVGGRVLCTLDNVRRVDRGVFAFKPAGGFLVRLKTPAGTVFAPGAWWRLGRTLAVGGVTPRRQAKEVADLLTILVIERDGGAP